VNKVLRHTLDARRSVAVAKSALAFYQGKYPSAGLKVDWSPDGTCARISFSLLGMSLVVYAVFGDRSVAMNAEVPVVMQSFASNALDVVEKHAKQWVESAGGQVLAEKQ
jgi:hypothetical protein